MFKDCEELDKHCGVLVTYQSSQTGVLGSNASGVISITHMSLLSIIDN